MEAPQHKVFVTRLPLPGAALEMLNSSCEVESWEEDKPIPRSVLLDKVKDAEGLFCLLTEKIDKELLDHAKKLRVIGTMSVGYDHIDVDAVKARGIKIGYTPDVLTNTTAELAVALTLATVRNFFQAEKAIRSGEWSSWTPTWMLGDGIEDSTVGIFGMGRIGISAVEKLLPFKPAKILYHNRTKNASAEKTLGVEYASFEDLLEKSDIVICLAALTEETKEIFNLPAFLKMKATAYFVNASRGGLVNQGDLLEALRNRVIKGAGLDVCTPEPLPPDHELLNMPNLTIIPHLGSATWQTRAKMAELTARNILAGLKGETMPAEL